MPYIICLASLTPSCHVNYAPRTAPKRKDGPTRWSVWLRASGLYVENLALTGAQLGLESSFVSAATLLSGYFWKWVAVKKP